jgi:hypothetical protein
MGVFDVLFGIIAINPPIILGITIIILLFFFWRFGIFGWIWYFVKIPFLPFIWAFRLMTGAGKSAAKLIGESIPKLRLNIDLAQKEKQSLATETEQANVIQNLTQGKYEFMQGLISFLEKAIGSSNYNASVRQGAKDYVVAIGQKVEEEKRVAQTLADEFAKDSKIEKKAKSSKKLMRTQNGVLKRENKRIAKLTKSGVKVPGQVLEILDLVNKITAYEKAIGQVQAADQKAINKSSRKARKYIAHLDAEIKELKAILTKLNTALIKDLPQVINQVGEIMQSEYTLDISKQLNVREELMTQLATYDVDVLGLLARQKELETIIIQKMAQLEEKRVVPANNNNFFKKREVA